jgi:hypothetical protein
MELHDDELLREVRQLSKVLDIWVVVLVSMVVY